MSDLNELKLKSLVQKYGEMSYDEALSIMFEHMGNLEVTRVTDPAYSFIHREASDFRNYVIALNDTRNLKRHEHLYFAAGYVEYSDKEITEFRVLLPISINDSEELNVKLVIRKQILEKYQRRSPGRTYLADIKDIVIDEYRPAFTTDL